jgi:hypothetical protein
MTTPPDTTEKEAKQGAGAFFDVNLPTKHAYLGDLREIYNRPYYTEGSLVILPFVYVPDVVLMPNQQMPINVEPYDLDLNPLLNDMIDVEHQRKGFVCMAADVASDLSHVKESHPYFLFATVASVVQIENPNANQQQVDAGNGQLISFIDSLIDMSNRCIFHFRIINSTLAVLRYLEC